MNDPVAVAIQESADAAIVPRFRLLQTSDIQQKQPGDYVTVADQECEELLERALATIAPGVPFLGEEAAAADPDLAERMLAKQRLWVVDPLDGTHAFIEGSPDFSVMVAMVERGETTAAWIYHPMHRVMWSASLGSGARRDGQLIRRLPTAEPVAGMSGYIKTGYMDPAVRADLGRRRHSFAKTGPGPASAGFSYPDLVAGATDFVIFWRTLPWDHAPGVLIAQEAGCHVARLDGAAYRSDQSGHGLLAAADSASWTRVRDTLLPP